MNKTILILIMGMVIFSFASAWTSTEFKLDETKNELTHYAYKIVFGIGILDGETRWVGAEGYLACDRKCTQLYLNQDKFKDYTTCKASC